CRAAPPPPGHPVRATERRRPARPPGRVRQAGPGPPRRRHAGGRGSHRGPHPRGRPGPLTFGKREGPPGGTRRPGGREGGSVYLTSINAGPAWLVPLTSTIPVLFSFPSCGGQKFGSCPPRVL